MGGGALQEARRACGTRRRHAAGLVLTAIALAAAGTAIRTTGMTVHSAETTAMHAGPAGTARARCDDQYDGEFHYSDGVYARPAGGIYVGDCLKVADRGPQTGRMYEVNPACFNFSDSAPCLSMAGAFAARDTAVSLQSAAVEYAALMRGVNPAQAFHMANGHPGRDRMRLILTNDLVDSPGPD